MRARRLRHRRNCFSENIKNTRSRPSNRRARTDRAAWFCSCALPAHGHIIGSTPARAKPEPPAALCTNGRISARWRRAVSRHSWRGPCRVQRFMSYHREAAPDLGRGEKDTLDSGEPSYSALIKRKWDLDVRRCLYRPWYALSLTIQTYLVSHCSTHIYSIAWF